MRVHDADEPKGTVSVVRIEADEETDEQNAKEDEEEGPPGIHPVA